jgi:predicted nucleic acid-binding protein
MEKIFIDSSALYALISTKDSDHERAVSSWDVLTQSDISPLTNNYILTECYALMQNRLGLDYVRELQIHIIPLLEIVWVDEEQHNAAVHQVLSSNRRNLSLVDCSAFDVMRRLGIETVFTFDEHFREHGFTIIP